MPSGGNARNRRFMRRHPHWRKPKIAFDYPQYSVWVRLVAWITRRQLDYTPKRRFTP